MNKVLIVDASESDRRLMAGLLVKSGYEPITAVLRYWIGAIPKMLLICSKFGIGMNNDTLISV